jgi:hypothetical protein
MNLATFAGLADRATPEHWELVGVRQRINGVWEAEFATGRGLAHVAFDFPPDDEAAAHGRDFATELWEVIASAVAGHGQPVQAEEQVHAETAPSAAQAGEQVSALSAEGRSLQAQGLGSARSAHLASLAAANWQASGDASAPVRAADVDDKEPDDDAGEADEKPTDDK